MKNKKLITFLSICLLTFWSCGNDDDSNNQDKEYYQFNEEDRGLIINYDYQIGDVIIYENQEGEKIHFEVILNEEEKRAYYQGSFVGGLNFLSNYYDSRIIRFEILENEDFEDKGLVNYIFSKNSDAFLNGINVPMWNIANFSFIDEIQNPSNILITPFNNLPKLQMEINNHVFDRVIIIESESNEVYQNSMYGTILKNVNKVYYDYDFGIIRFDDIEGNQWKLIYPD